MNESFVPVSLLAAIVSFSETERTLGVPALILLRTGIWTEDRITDAVRGSMFSVPSKSELLLVACPPSLSHQLQSFLGHAHTIFRFTFWSNRCTVCRGLWKKLSLEQEFTCTSRKTARDCIVGHTGMCMSAQSRLNGDTATQHTHYTTVRGSFFRALRTGKFDSGIL